MTDILKVKVNNEWQSIPAIKGDNGEGVPEGGTTGQVLKKKTNTDYDTEWGTVDALPSQSGQSGKYLTTNGTQASWSTVDALPSQTGHSGKYLTTNGSSASWGVIDLALSNLSDAHISAPLNDQILKYNSTTNKWENKNTTSGSSYHPTIFSHQWSDHLKDDIQWLRADTFSWQSGSVYTLAYNELVSEYNSATDVEINAIKVGNPTVSSSGVVSGFSASNYVKLPNSLSFNSTSNIEIILKINTGTDISTEQQVIFGTNNLINNTLMITQKANKIRWNTYGVAGTDTITITQNQDLYIKITAISGTYTLYTSSNGTDWTSQGTKPVLDYSCIPFLGYTSGDDYTYFRGSIDLSESYIKINNSIWWSGEFCKRSPKGYKIVTADKEQAILNKYNTDGIAWYYILDTTNTQFKLPRTKFGFEGLRDTVGNDVGESLPNIIGGSGGWLLTNTNGANGCFSGNRFAKTLDGYTTNPNWNIIANGGEWYRDINFDASLSSSTYQDNAPVQERATQMYLYFYVGEYAQTAIEQTAGLNSELFNGKVDINLNNVTNANFLTKFQGCGQVYLKTTYVNGTSGYNIWSNGYCEQWGEVTGGWYNDNWVTVSFPKTFANTNYNVSAICFIQGYNYSINSVSEYTTNYVKFNQAQGNGSTTRNFRWRAFGYLASGQY